MLRFWTDLFSFLDAVLLRRANLVVGGVIMASVWIWTDGFEFKVPPGTSGLLVVAFLGVATFLAWREEHSKVKTLEANSAPPQEANSALPQEAESPVPQEAEPPLALVVKSPFAQEAESPLPQKARLRVKLKSFQKKSWDASDVTSDGFQLIVTNLAKPVSITHMDVFVTRYDGAEVLLPPAEPFLSLPTPLGEAGTAANCYLLGTAGLEKIASVSPRVVIKTACGTTRVLGPKAFRKLRSVDVRDPS